MFLIWYPPLSPSLIEIPRLLLEEAWGGGAEEGAPEMALDLPKQDQISLQKLCF